MAQTEIAGTRQYQIAALTDVTGARYCRTLAYSQRSPVAASDVLTFQIAPSVPFVISGVPLARDAALVEAGLDLALNRNATIGMSFTGQLASNVQDHAAKGKFSWKF